MSHKDAPPLNDEQRRFEAWWIARKGAGFCGFGRGKSGEYLAEFVKDAWEAWEEARR